MRTDSPVIKAILVDLFDTTIYCSWSELRREMAITSGAPVSDFLEGYRQTQAERNIGKYGSERRDLEEITRAGGVKLTERQISSLIEFERDYLSSHGDYYPDVEDFLRSAKLAGLVTGVISNCSRGAKTLIDRLEVRKHVDLTLLSFDVGLRKPDREIYRRALRKLNVDPGQTLFIDDQPKFCVGATAVGMNALLIRRNIADHQSAPSTYPHVSTLNMSVVSKTDLFIPPTSSTHK